MYTKGPWKIEEELIVKDNKLICEIISDFSYATISDQDLLPKLKEAQANARLISAAPELLELLKSIMLPINRGTSGRIIIEKYQEENIKKVISKAEGK